MTRTLAQRREIAKQAGLKRAAEQLYELLETDAARQDFLLRRSLGLIPGLPAGGSPADLAALNASRGPRW